MVLDSFSFLVIIIILHQQTEKQTEMTTIWQKIGSISLVECIIREGMYPIALPKTNFEGWSCECNKTKKVLLY